MNFTFAKELIDDDPASTPNKPLRLYKIWDESNQLVGQFCYYPNKPIINFNDREIAIEVIANTFKKTKYFLVDKTSNAQVGQYEVFGGYGANHFWQDVPSSPTGTIKLGDTLFNFRRIPAGTKYSFFKQDTWGYFTFRLYATKGREYYEYALKMDIPVWSKPYYTKYRPFTGTIACNADNILAVLAGLYLMEIEFDYEDTKGDG